MVSLLLLQVAQAAQEQRPLIPQETAPAPRARLLLHPRALYWQSHLRSYTRRPCFPVAQLVVAVKVAEPSVLAAVVLRLRQRTRLPRPMRVTAAWPLVAVHPLVALRLSTRGRPGSVLGCAARTHCRRCRRTPYSGAAYAQGETCCRNWHSWFAENPVSIEHFHGGQSRLHSSYCPA